MTRTYYLAAFALFALTLLATLLAYPYLPNIVPRHWDLYGHADAYSPKWFLFVPLPCIMLGTILLFSLLPWLSPKHFQVDAFRATYLQFMLIILVSMAYMHAVLLWAGFGHAMNASRALAAGGCLLVAMLGNLMGKVRRNFWIGIRTPWTLASERTWYATHRFAARTVLAGGLLGFALTLARLPMPILWPTVSIFAGVLAPAVYSLVFYKQLERHGQL